MLSLGVISRVVGRRLELWGKDVRYERGGSDPNILGEEYKRLICYEINLERKSYGYMIRILGNGRKFQSNT